MRGKEEGVYTWCVCVCVCGEYTHVFTGVGSASAEGRPAFFTYRPTATQRPDPAGFPPPSFSTAAAVNYFYNYLSPIILNKAVC